ncbi:TetR/AcrR family transcriptional regulator [Micromonospora sp. NPDC003776]
MTRRTPGTPAGLTRERITAAAVDLVDRHGLEAFGVRRLATELAVDPMSIYHHIKGKAALLDAVSEAVLTETAPDAIDPDGPWDDIAWRVAHVYRNMALRHPRVLPLLATRAQRSPVALAAVETLIAAMLRDGLPDRVAADAPLALFGFLNGYLLATVRPAPEDGATSMDDVDADAYPALAALAPLLAGFGSEAEFERMLDMVLVGIRSRGADGTVAG